MEKFNKRLSDAMQLRNLSQKDLCDRTGIKKSAMSQYVSGGFQPKGERIYALARALNVSPVWLMGYDVDINYTGLLVSYPDTDDNDELYEKFPNIRPITTKRVPMLGRIACGEPLYADEEHELYVDVNSDLRADFCLTCAGDSMEPKIHDGDIVFIQKTDSVDDGQIAAVIIEDEATLKRVYYDKPNNVLTLVAENPKYRPLVYTGEQLDHIKVLGRAVSLYRNII